MTTTTFQTNTFAKGMNMDVDASLLGDDQYLYAENVRLITNDQGTTGVLQNIEGVKKYTNVSIPDNELIIGTTVINKMAIVVTKVLDSGFYKLNKIYRVNGFNTDTPIQTVICRGDLGLCKEPLDTSISIVGNYETESNIKVYFTDGNTSVKVLNVVDGKYEGVGPTNPLLDSSGNILNPLALDITPSSQLPPFQVVDLQSGNLASGVIQYCYQLFNLHGSETTISTLSPMVHLTDSTVNQTLTQYKGQYPNNNSGKSCVLQAPIESKDFQKCRIISISYSANNVQPRIFIVDEIDIIPSQTSIEYIDNGNNIISELTVDKFNQMTGYQFIAKTLTKLDNRLFAANVQEDSWDPEFDARAFRTNSNGLLTLNSADVSQSISVTLPSAYEDRMNLYKSIPKQHDCINPFNKLKSSQFSVDNQYEYSAIRQNDILLKGGSGLNVDYTFITAATFHTDSSTGTKIVQDGLPLADMPKIFSKGTSNENVGLSLSPIPLEGVASINPQTKTVQTYEVFKYANSALPNYANPLIASRYKSLQRDEVYRYGIILYNKKHVPSPVKWIGDIRMPHASEEDFIPFYPNNNYLNGKPLGIKFTVRNIPEGCIAFEIVRCDRTETDRSIILQAALSIVANNTVADEQGGIGGPLDTRPYIFLSYAGHPGGTVIYRESFSSFPDKKEYSVFDGSLIKDSYVTAISPEISFSGDSIEKQFKNNTYLDSIYALSSPIGDVRQTGEIGVNTYHRIGSSADKTIRDKDGSTVSKIQGIGASGITDSNGIRYTVLNVAEDWDDYGMASLVSKYYVPFSNVGFATSSSTEEIIIRRANKKNVDIQDVKYPKTIPYNGLSDKSPYYQTVGDIVYLNFAQSEWVEMYNHGGTANKFGIFGPCLVLQAKSVRKTIHSIRRIGDTYGSLSWGKDTNYDDRTAYTVNAIQIANIKKVTNPYGGDTFATRQNSIYIPIGAYDKLHDSENILYTYGGDTFLNVLDQPVVTMFQDKNPEDRHESKIFVGALIPFESSINLNLAQGDAAQRTWRSSDNFLDVFAQIEPGQMGSYHTQDAPYFAYNNTYSVQPGSKKFIPASIYAESDIKNSNRIVCSEAKTNNETLDNWTTFKFANYLDVDNQYGDITNLKAFKGRLFFWQDSALGIASVNERSLISDNNAGALTLGTGGILTRADYITITNGSSVTNDRSIVNSDSTIYWYDFDKNEICSYGNGVDQISKTKGVQSYLNEMYSGKRNVTLALYDKKYNEVWFKFYDKSLIFNEQLGQFTSFYTFNPQQALQFSDKVVTIKDNSYYIINTLDIDNLGDVNKNAKVSFVVNKDGAYTKTFDNVFFSGEFKDPSTTNDLEAIHNVIGKRGSITYSTKDQFAYPLLIDDKVAIDYREYTYRFAIGREELEKQTAYSEMIDSYAGRMKGKYLVCNYTFDCNNDKTFKLPYINTTYRYSLV